MSYIGQNELFSFRDGRCESLPGKVLSSARAAGFGRVLAGTAGRFIAGCGNYSHTHILYALCSGLSECGREVYLCEDTDMQSFRYSIPMLSADCGVYISGTGQTVIMDFFRRDRLPFSRSETLSVMNGAPAERAGRPGRLTQFTSFRSIYLNSIRDSLGPDMLPISAGVSCGCREVRSLWLEFFSGESDELVFQVSEDGSRVNAYSRSAGFISHEKLLICYAAKCTAHGQRVWLPDRVHYAAEESAGSMISRFSRDELPEDAASQRHLFDPLYMCTALVSDVKSFLHMAGRLPAFSSSKREVTVDAPDKVPVGKSLTAPGGRVILERSGRNRISVLAQAYSAETAAELCCSWTEKLRRFDKCGGPLI